MMKLNIRKQAGEWPFWENDYVEYDALNERDKIAVATLDAADDGSMHDVELRGIGVKAKVFTGEVWYQLEWYGNVTYLVR
jgi:hypothetical protein